MWRPTLRKDLKRSGPLGKLVVVPDLHLVQSFGIEADLDLFAGELRTDLVAHAQERKDTRLVGGARFLPQEGLDGVTSPEDNQIPGEPAVSIPLRTGAGTVVAIDVFTDSTERLPPETGAVPKARELNQYLVVTPSGMRERILGSNACGLGWDWEMRHSPTRSAP